MRRVRKNDTSQLAQPHILFDYGTNDFESRLQFLFRVVSLDSSTDDGNVFALGTYIMRRRYAREINVFFLLASELVSDKLLPDLRPTCFCGMITWQESELLVLGMG